MFELPQPPSRAAIAATPRDGGRPPPTRSVGECVRARVRTSVSIAPGRPLAPQAGMQRRCTKDRLTESLSLQREPGIKGTRSPPGPGHHWSQAPGEQTGASLRAFPVALSAAQLGKAGIRKKRVRPCSSPALQALVRRPGGRGRRVPQGVWCLRSRDHSDPWDRRAGGTAIPCSSC